MDFEPSAALCRVQGAPRRVHGRARLPGRAGLRAAAARVGRPAPPARDHGGAEGGGARRRGLWNMFLPDEEHGAGPVQQPTTRRSPRSWGARRSPPRRATARRPDTGNMEVLHQFGTRRAEGAMAAAAARRRDPLGVRDDRARRRELGRDQHRSCGSSATATSYVLNGRKWWTTERDAPALPDHDRDGQDQTRRRRIHKQQSQILVPIDTPGVTVVRELPVFGYHGPGRPRRSRLHRRARPATNLIAGEGDGFMIAQARLGPGRIHHCMRAIGAAERALEAMCRRAVSRVTFGQPVAMRGNIQDWIAESRIEIEMARLLTLKAAWLMDTVGNRHARTEIAAIKVAAPERRAEGARPRDPGARRRRRLRRLRRSPAPTRTCARCASPTAPTRCTSSRSPGASSRPYIPREA